MSNINTDFLRDLNRTLVLNDDAINDTLEPFHFEVVAGIKKIKAAIKDATDVSQDYLPEVRAKKQSEILGKAYKDLQVTVDKGAQPILAAPHMLHADLAAAARPKTKETDGDIQRVLDLLTLHHNQDILKNMTLDERSSLLRSSTAAGDGSILHAMEKSLIPLLPAGSLDIARDVFVRASSPDLVKKTEKAEALSSTAKHTMDMLPKAVESLMRDAGLEKPFADRNADKKAAALNMTVEQKSKYISEHGSEAFRKMMSGE